MKQHQVNNVTYLKDRRKQLRNNLTPAEATLWKALKGSALNGRKFRRQHSVENYILDFYCPEEKLAVELDGQVHNDPMQAVYDEERTNRINQLGIKVVRFENKLVFEDMIGVLRVVASHFKSA
jgi:very-short-patch-repair endonuclease